MTGDSSYTSLGHHGGYTRSRWRTAQDELPTGRRATQPLESRQASVAVIVRIQPGLAGAPSSKGG